MSAARMASMLGGGYVNYFSLDQRSYKVIPQVAAALSAQHRPVAQLLRRQRQRAYRCRCRRSRRSRPRRCRNCSNHFQQLNSATIQGVAVPGVAQADALGYLKDLAAQTLPQGLHDRLWRPVAAIRPGIQSGFIVTFGFALVIIFLSLARAVRKFPRSLHHSDLGADVDRRRADLRQRSASAAPR